MHKFLMGGNKLAETQKTLFSKIENQDYVGNLVSFHIYYVWSIICSLVEALFTYYYLYIKFLKKTL